MVDINVRDRFGRSPLYYAATTGHEGIMKLLLETQKVEVDARANAKHTSLSSAARNGGQVAARDREGRTQLNHQNFFRTCCFGFRIRFTLRNVFSGLGKRSRAKYMSSKGLE